MGFTERDLLNQIYVAASEAIKVVLAANGGVDIGDVTLTEGTASIGKLAANSGVDIGDVTLTAGTAVVGATKDAGTNFTSTLTYTTSADMQTAAAISPAPSTGEYLVVDDIIASADTAMSIEFELEDAASTNYVKLFLAANSVLQVTPRGKWKLGTANKKLFADCSAAGNVAFSVWSHSEA